MEMARDLYNFLASATNGIMGGLVMMMLVITRWQAVFTQHFMATNGASERVARVRRYYYDA